MISKATAGVQGTHRLRCILALAAILMVLSVPAGLLSSGASHLHRPDESHDCNLCTLASHFVIETAPALDLGAAGPDPILVPVSSTPLHDRPVPAPAVRGPPTVSA